MEVPLAQLVVTLPLSVLLLCNPLVLRRRLPSPSLSPRPLLVAVALCAAAALPLPLRRRKAAAAATAAAAAPSFVCWLLRCCLRSDFVIACRHATVNALIAGVNILVRIGMY